MDKIKIKAMNIFGFGKWQQMRWRIPSDIALFYGPNEAGKSTIFQFLLTMLFGFPKNKKQADRYRPLSGERFGGELVLDFPKTGEVRIRRLKDGSKQTCEVIFSDGRTAGEADLRQLLTPFNREIYEAVYSFNHEALDDLGVLEEASLETLVYSLGLTGSEVFLQASRQLEKDSQDLYKPQGTNPLLNQKLTALKAVTDERIAAEAQESDYQKVAAELDATVCQLDELSKRMVEQEHALSVNNRQHQDLPLYKEAQTIMQTLRYEQADQLLDIEEYQRLQVLNEKWEMNQRQLSHLQKERNEQLALGALTPKVAFYMQHESEISQLVLDEGGAERVLRQRRDIEDELTQLSRELEKIKENFRWRKGVPKPLTSREEILLQDLAKESDNISLALEQEEEDNEALQVNIARMSEAIRQEEARLRKRPRPTLLTQMKPWFLASAGCILLVISIALLTSFLRYAGVAGGICLLGAGLIILIQRKRNKTEQFTIAELDAQNDELLAQESASEARLVKLQEKETACRKSIAEVNRNKNFPADYTPKDWQASRGALLRAHTLMSQIEGRKVLLAELAQEETLFWERLSPLKSWLPLESMTLKEAFDAVRQYRGQMEHEKQAAALNRPGIDTWQLGMNVLDSTMQELKSNAQPLLKKAGIEQMESVPGFLKAYAESARKRSRLEELKHLLADDSLLSEPELAEILTREKRELDKKIIRTRESLSILQQKEQALRFKETQMRQKQDVDQLRQREVSMEAEVRTLAESWLVKKIAKEIVEETQRLLADDGLGIILEKTSDYLVRLTGGRIKAIQLAEKKFTVLNHKGQKLSLEQLSVATIHQLKLALRLAFIYGNRKQTSMPLLLDDVWLHFDKDRKARFFGIIKEISQEMQVLCFSSDEAAKEFAEQVGCVIELEGGE